MCFQLFPTLTSVAAAVEGEDQRKEIKGSLLFPCWTKAYWRPLTLVASIASSHEYSWSTKNASVLWWKNQYFGTQGLTLFCIYLSSRFVLHAQGWIQGDNRLIILIGGLVYPPSSCNIFPSLLYSKASMANVFGLWFSSWSRVKAKATEHKQWLRQEGLQCSIENYWWWIKTHANLHLLFRTLKLFPL